MVCVSAWHTVNPILFYFYNEKSCAHLTAMNEAQYILTTIHIECWLREKSFFRIVFAIYDECVYHCACAALLFSEHFVQFQLA